MEIIPLFPADSRMFSSRAPGHQGTVKKQNNLFQSVTKRGFRLAVQCAGPASSHYSKCPLLTQREGGSSLGIPDLERRESGRSQAAVRKRSAVCN